jgi:protein required for attachment to host cells
MKPRTTWVLVADGATAKVFSYDSNGAGLMPIEGMMFGQDHLRAQDIESDRPGRSFASVGHGRSGYEPETDPVQLREQRFVKHVAQTLEERFRRKEFDRLVVAAAPTALGDLRPQLSKELQAAVVAEVAKDLTRSPTDKLEAQLGDVLTH